MTCTASVDLIDRLTEEGKIAPDSTLVYAAEGTVAHEIREMCLNLGLDPHHFVGRAMSADGFTFTVTEDMASHLQTGIDWVREMTQAPDVEIRVDLSHWLPGQFGTCDTGWINEEKAEPVFNMNTGEWETQIKRTLYVSDLKYGQGENVEAVGNRQIRIYALGYWAYKGFPTIDRVILNIDQPRAGGMKFWEITADELFAFAKDEVVPAFSAIDSGETTFAPGSKACRWCPVKGVGCPVRDEWMFDMIADEPHAYAGETPRFPVAITPVRRWNIVRHAKEIREWLAKLHEDSLTDALAGNPDPGSKAVEGDLGDRYFTDQEAAKRILVGALGRHAFKPRQIIGITDIEKHLKPGKKKQGNPDAWEALLKLVDRPQGKPKLVPETHPKPALASDLDEFDDLDPIGGA